MPGRGFVSESALAFFLSPALLFGAAWKKADLSEDTTFFLFLSFGFLCLTMMSLRFVEYWPVYAILVSACFVRDLNLPIQWDYFDDESHKHKYSKKDIRLGRWATGITLFVVLLFSARTYNHTLIKIEHIGESRIKPAALWMKENIPAKETVFHGDWDDFPELFFYNPNNYYLTGLDPIFMYASDPDLWIRWKKIGRGETSNPDIEIKKNFNARYAFFTKDLHNAIEQFRKHPKITAEFEDQNCIIFEIHDKFVNQATGAVTIQDATFPK